MQKPSLRSCMRNSAGFCTPPSCHQPSMHREANTTRHSSPALSGNVSVTPPPPGKTTGQSRSTGMSISSYVPSGSRLRPLIAGCTLTVCLSGSKDTMMPGSAVQILLCRESMATRWVSSGSENRSLRSICDHPKSLIAPGIGCTGLAWLRTPAGTMASIDRQITSVYQSLPRVSPLWLATMT